MSSTREMGRFPQHDTVPLTASHEAASENDSRDTPLRLLIPGLDVSGRHTGLRCAEGIRRRFRVIGVLGVAIAAFGLAIAGVAFGRIKTSLAHSGRDSLSIPFRLYEGGLAMPSRATQYDGIEDERDVPVWDGPGGVAHVFAIGDWGATEPNHKTFGAKGGEEYAQFSVANVFKARAKMFDPQYVLNVGDNFYVEGLESNCYSPPGDEIGATSASFSSVWQFIYGPTASKPWLSVLGNHDYGGWLYSKGWPQQIGYSFVNHNWIMPARYYSKRVKHPTFNIDYFMIDSNVYDAKMPNDDPDHNMCSWHHNGDGASCAANDGPTSTGGCRGWFWGSWRYQQKWLEQKLAASDARWKILVTHFPCGFDADWYKVLKAKYGLDLIVTGHRHQQELWRPNTTSKYVRSFLGVTGWDDTSPACFVTGGGGGISSQNFAEADYGNDLAKYGFFHLTIRKDSLGIELIDGFDAQVKGAYTIYPHGSQALKDHPVPQVNKWVGGLCAAFCGDMHHAWNDVCQGGKNVVQACEGCKECREKVL